MSRYFMTCKDEKLELVKGILDFLVEDIIILPHMLGTESNGFIFTIKESCKDKWENFYFSLLLDKGLTELGEMIYNINSGYMISKEVEEDDTKKLLRLWG